MGERKPGTRSRADDPRRREYVRAHHLMRKYGITVEHYAELLVRQQGVCAVCLEDNGDMRLAVDHDHRTGAIRGLLCTRCNRGLGYFRDAPALLRMAAKYLEREQ